MTHDTDWPDDRTTAPRSRPLPRAVEPERSWRVCTECGCHWDGWPGELCPACGDGGDE